MDEEAPTGGNSHPVVRVEDTVRRPAGPWMLSSGRQWSVWMTWPSSPIVERPIRAAPSSSGMRRCIVATATCSVALCRKTTGTLHSFRWSLRPGRGSPGMRRTSGQGHRMDGREQGCGRPVLAGCGQWPSCGSLVSGRPSSRRPARTRRSAGSAVEVTVRSYQPPDVGMTTVLPWPVLSARLCVPLP